MIDKENNCAAILELNKSLGSADVIFFLRVGEGEKKNPSAQRPSIRVGQRENYIFLKHLVTASQTKATYLGDALVLGKLRLQCPSQ